MTLDELEHMTLRMERRLRDSRVVDVLIDASLRIDSKADFADKANIEAFVERLKPRRAFFTHMGHELDHTLTEASLPPHIRLAYDGLQLHFEIA